MTMFLSADGMRDNLKALSKALKGLEEIVGEPGTKTQLDWDQVERMQELVETAQDNMESISALIESFPCAPLIYTGNEDTEQVIAKLQSLLTHSQ